VILKLQEPVPVKSGSDFVKRQTNLNADDFQKIARVFLLLSAEEPSGLKIGSSVLKTVFVSL